MYYSPLRYPGGKAKLAPFMGYIIKKLNLTKGTYIEPFAGGAGIAIELLLSDKVGHIVINDYDKAVASFWRAATDNTDCLIEKMYNTPITIEEWYKQRTILLNSNSMSFELGFATFFLNRTNRSGILKGGPIGGKNQDGEWRLDARFNKPALEKRLVNIGERRKDITVYNQDVSCLIKKYIPRFGDSSLIYFDPPYYEKGSGLYMNYFNYNDHLRIERDIRNYVKCKWIITYDNVDEIHRIYDGYKIKTFSLDYCAASRRSASELMIFSDPKMCPTNKMLSKSDIEFSFQ